VFVDLRGNIPTRLRKMKSEGLDGIVLAGAGLLRLGYSSPSVHRLPPQICLPAAGQGALAIEARADDREILALVRGIEHQPSRLEVEAEREFLLTLGGGCHVPVGALGRVVGDRLVLEGVITSPDGARIARGRLEGTPVTSREIGRSLALELMSSGGADILGMSN
jgi:hydroxymethylbilane synthase